ncbi:MAG: 16S rRNA (adenine(1518)-N(6)/adenine(1519)-N(6))-dimethyltransferase RsmA [Fusobacteriaceae bacterium]|jgi:16S rRNA (adenine1518-N6/adenine1519-N6)-dimethyltransferase|nr:16S rRNA (adenine(1518)-N(6)/adenine(1519)-N(6))-dimethyltransferase RsmA [Fusobacteriaceae bacterium]
MAFRAKKKYGQNFLAEKSDILGKIIDTAEIGKDDCVLEIGPGQGALTALLLDHAWALTAVEIDPDLEERLRRKFAGYERFELIMADFLTLDLRAGLESWRDQGKRVKLVANIPYYITSPILRKLMEYRDLLDGIFIMVQKEVGKRICASSGKARGVLTLAVEYYGEASYGFTIDRSAFTPAPNVDSAFITIRPWKDRRWEQQIAGELFFRYIRTAFAGKRKTLLNNLAVLGISKAELSAILTELGIDAAERAENVSIAQFTRLIPRLEAALGK